MASLVPESLAATMAMDRFGRHDGGAASGSTPSRADCPPQDSKLWKDNLSMHDVVIIGAGLAGLCCARELTRQGRNCLLLEASDRVGGRVRTEIVDGFRIDRGFQVLLTSYPEARAVLDFDALQLHEFLPGALVRYGGKFHELTDPWRRPFAALKSLASPIEIGRAHV